MKSSGLGVVFVFVAVLDIVLVLLLVPVLLLRSHLLNVTCFSTLASLFLVLLSE